MSSNVCKNCGKLNEPNFKFCAFCGEKLPYLVCSKCGEVYNKDYIFCGECGGLLVKKTMDDEDSEIEETNNNEDSEIEESSDNEDSKIFYLNYKNKYTARGIQTENGFVLLKGARIREDIVESALPHIINSREKNKSKIKDSVTTEDILFNSSSGAASFVAGSNVSGPRYWVSEGGQLNRRRPSKRGNNHSIDDSQIFYLKSKEYSGQGSYDGEIFTLFKGSRLNQFLASHAEKQVINLRKKNKSKIENFITTDNILFNSPSSAANFISGRAMNGRKEWKNKNGESINDIERK